jgi:hypothetical protein
MLFDAGLPAGIRDILTAAGADFHETTPDAIAQYLRGISRIVDAARELDLAEVFYDGGFATTDEWSVRLPEGMTQGSECDIFLLSCQAMWAIKRAPCWLGEADSVIRLCMCGDTSCDIGGFSWIKTSGQRFRIEAT